MSKHPTAPSHPTVAIGLARGLTDFAVSRGAARSKLLALSGVAETDLDGWDARLPLHRYVRLVRAAKRLTNQPAFALHYGANVGIEEVSILGLIAQQPVSPQAMLLAMNQYSSLVIDVAFEGPQRLAFEQADGGLWLIDNRLNPNEVEELTESFFARVAATLRRQGVQRPTLSVQVTHARPLHWRTYAEVLGARVQFDCPRNAMLLAPSIARARFPRQPDYVADLLEERASTLLEQMAGAKTIAHRVEERVAASLADGKFTIEAVAAQLGMSRLTLYRRLRAEGTRFEALLDGVRTKLAMHYLGDRKLSVVETAERLGFADRAAFSKAFKRWTGFGPGSIRSQMGQGRIFATQSRSIPPAT